MEFSDLTWRGYSEFVVEADSAQGPVELFDDIEFSDPDEARLREATGSRLAQVSDRALATPMPSLSGIPVILSRQGSRGSVRLVFRQFHDIGHIHQGFALSPSGHMYRRPIKAARPPTPSICGRSPTCSGLAASSPFDADGFPLERTQVIQGGYLRNLVGPIRYADWLGVERKGSFPLFSVSPGSYDLLRT